MEQVEKKTTIRKKTLYIIGITFISLIFFVYLVSSFLLMDDFEEIERHDTEKNLQRAVMIMNDDISGLDNAIGDYTAWDETYEFIQEPDVSYLERNIWNVTFVQYRLNFMFFMNLSGGTVYNRGFDYLNLTEIQIPEGFANYLSPGSTLLNQSDKNGSVKGIIVIPEGPLMVVSRPITDSEVKKPIKGYLVWARYLDGEEIDRLENLTHLSINVEKYNADTISLDFRKARESLSDKKPEIIRTISEQSVAGYALLNDIDGKPALLLRVDLPRPIYNQGKTSLNYFFISLILIGIIFGLIFMLLLEKFVLSRVARLNSDVTRIGQSGDFSNRVAMEGGDELSNLAVSINNMMNSLENSEKRFSRVAESVNDAIISIDSNSKILFWNNGAQKIFGFTREEMIGNPITTIIPSEYMDAHKNGVRTISNPISHTIGKTIELKGVKKDGTEFPLELSLASWKSRNEIYHSGIIRDITERKLTEEKIKKSLDEKETLLKEIHHRVKNNMQIVSSLLNHQIRYINKKNVMDIIAQSQSRITSMSLIHEKLYRSKDLAQIDFKEYINDLAARLFHSFKVDSDKISLNINVENIYLDIDTAIPCGLIINELITNSLKYAFPDGRKGEIKILFHKVDDIFELLVCDNGIGLPDYLDFRKTDSLGLHLVTILAENQLHGEIMLKRNNGTNFQIRFSSRK